MVASRKLNRWDTAAVRGSSQMPLGRFRTPLSASSRRPDSRFARSRRPSHSPWENRRGLLRVPGYWFQREEVAQQPEQWGWLKQGRLVAGRFPSGFELFAKGGELVTCVSPSDLCRLGGGQLIAAFVVGVTGVTFEPAPLNAMPAGGFVELFP